MDAEIILINEENNIELEERNNKITRKFIREANEKEHRKKLIRLIINIFILLFILSITMIYVNRNGLYPWGSDVYGHLFKAEILYDSIREGNLFLNYDFNWYNGIQPYRYWGPLSYYILALLNFIAKNMIVTYNLFIIIIFLIGSIGFLLWGYYLERQNLGLVLGLLWFFVPNNLDVVFAQGNVPYIVAISIVPYLLLVYYKSFVEKRISNYFFISLIMSIITLDHAMLTAIIGVSLFLFTLFYCIYNKKFKEGFLSLSFAFLGILVSSYWLIPALKGGIVGQGKETVTETMSFFVYPLIESINPLIKDIDREQYYFGLAFLITAIFGLLFSNKGEKSGFVVTVLVLLGTTVTASKLLSKLPMSELFWMVRFTSIAIAMMFFSLMLWKSLRKGVLVFLVGILILDCIIPFKALASNTPGKEEQIEFLKVANEAAIQRVAMLDSSSYGSFPSYYITYNKQGKSMPQVYGWAWQGATTGDNIVFLNEALEENYFHAMFDRTLELGADVLIVKLSMVKDNEELYKAAEAIGYNEIWKNSQVSIFKYPVDTQFGTIVQYTGIAIGEFAANLPLMFPSFTCGESEYIDDYEIHDLLKYENIYLSGFKYRDKEKAEEKVKLLADSGVNVVIDVEGFEESFRGVTAVPITLKKNYGDFFYKGKQYSMTDCPEEYKEFKTYFISSDSNKNINNSCITGNRVFNYLYEEEENLKYIGLNVPYYTKLTKDEVGISILEDLFKEKSNRAPNREVVKIDVNIQEDEKIIVKAHKGNILLPIAAIDAFSGVSEEYKSFNNLIFMKNEELVLTIGYPYLKIGIFLSIVAIIMIFGLLFLLRKKRCHRWAKF